jgi:hypothetical protein
LPLEDEVEWEQLAREKSPMASDKILAEAMRVSLGVGRVELTDGG